jgi:hypothetical protein
MSDALALEKNDWLERNLKIRLGQVARGDKADALDVTFDELVRVEQQILNATRPVKPAELQGRFTYLEDAVQGAADQVERFTDPQVAGGKHTKSQVLAKANELRDNIASNKERLIGLALDELTRVAGAQEAKAASLEQQAGGISALAPDAQAAARTQLYKDASGAMTTLSRELTDWRAQVEEARVWMGPTGGKFRQQLDRLVAAQTRMDTVVGNAVPPLNTRKAVGDEKPRAALPGGAPIPEIGDTDKDARDALEACGSSWVTAKQVYGGDKTKMQKLANYRKKIVDEWLTRELGKYGLKVGAGTGWVSVGSTDPTSDYDISINKHGTVDGKPGSEPYYDYQMVQEFNKWFRGEYGGEGGTVFDTNLYASAPSQVTTADPDGVATGDVAALMKMRRYMSGGEFEAMRKDTVRACGKDMAAVLKVEQQFQEADFNYRVALFETVESGIEKLRARTADWAKKAPLAQADQQLQDAEQHLLEEAAALLERGKQATGVETADLQTEVEEMAREIEHALKDATLETTNEVYAEKKGQVRQQERVVVALAALQEAVKKTPPDREALGKALGEAAGAMRALKIDSKSVTQAQAALQAEHPEALAKALEEVSVVIAGELGERRQQLGRAEALAMFFANEAYQSTGPFAHVVTATQAAEADGAAEVINDAGNVLTEDDKKLPPKTQAAIVQAGGRDAYDRLPQEERTRIETEKQGQIETAQNRLKTERRAVIPKDQCLQSFNEQLGDFLKDLEHYGDDDPGKAIIQSSKYLERLLDAVNLMIGKNMFDADKDLLVSLKSECEKQADIKNELIAARKGNLMLMPKEGNDPVDQAEQRRAFACQFLKEKLKVNSLAGLAQRYTALAVKINKAARINILTSG